MPLENLLRRVKFILMYVLNPPWDTGQSPPELMEFLSAQPAGRALDLGCGTGTNALTLARHAWQVLGVDFAPNAIRQARRKAELAGLQASFQVGDVTKLAGIEGTFDLVLDIGCYHALTPGGRAAYRTNLKRVLAQGGTYLLYAFVEEGNGRPASGITDMEIGELSSWLSLDRKQVGTERGLRPSAWFWFSRPKDSD